MLSLHHACALHYALFISIVVFSFEPKERIEQSDRVDSPKFRRYLHCDSSPLSIEGNSIRNGQGNASNTNWKNGSRKICVRNPIMWVAEVSVSSWNDAKRKYGSHNNHTSCLKLLTSNIGLCLKNKLMSNKPFLEQSREVDEQQTLLEQSRH
ncbi:hypothetical protein Patl1_14186 [Pistacia atlantica]|uniref:Uncharacterized protein n=1 Tax=Pistacia atlantica TaxID=434234 RepID=A0ACC1AYD0_9ROSI|nr:hypothetical protein Patl1_14186 [Pistacia atlantica]